jgi:hypothetical protein
VTGTSPSTEPGTVVLTLVTSDSSPIPDDTIVCLGDVCQALDAIAAAAAPSGTLVTFTGVDPNTYPVTVYTGGIVVFSEQVEIVAGQLLELTITIDPAAPTEGPGTPDNGNVDPGGENDDSYPSGDGDDPGSGTNGGGGAAVTTLPATGSGASASLEVYLVLLAILGLIASAALAWKQRRT